MKILGREINPSEKPLIVAEIGINHGGDLELAKEMVFKASRAGAECIKHQTHFVEDEMTSAAKNIVPPNAEVSIWEVIEKCALSMDAEIELKSHTESLGMIYISTPFSRKAANFLAEIDVPAFKIGSGECNNYPLVSYISSFKKPVIISTGMNDLKSIKKAIKILKKK